MLILKRYDLKFLKNLNLALQSRAELTDLCLKQGPPELSTVIPEITLRGIVGFSYGRASH